MKNYLKSLAFFVFILLMIGCGQVRVPYATNAEIDVSRGGGTFTCNGVEEDFTGSTVAVWRLNDGYCYPIEVFSQPTDPDECEHVHYHYPLLALGGHERSFNAGACGFATKDEFEITGFANVKRSVVEDWNREWNETTDFFGIDSFDQETSSSE